MAKKIKLSELKLKSSVTLLDKKQRKAAKGGYVNFSLVQKDTKIADTQVDIRFTKGGGQNNNSTVVKGG
jgi:hypothetical protein